MPKVVGLDLRRDLISNPPKDLTIAHARKREMAIEMIQSESLAKASYCYNIVPLDDEPGEFLSAKGRIIHAPKLLPEAGTLTSLGFGSATLGPLIEKRIMQLFTEKQASLAVAMNHVATEMLFVLGRRIQDRMLSECVRKRLTMGGELSAGDPGLDIEAQSTMLELSGAEEIGISLNEHHMMVPINSITTLFAVGKDLPAVRWSRCDSCPSNNRCNFGRQTSAALNS